MILLDTSCCLLEMICNYEQDSVQLMWHGLSNCTIIMVIHVSQALSTETRQNSRRSNDITFSIVRILPNVTFVLIEGNNIAVYLLVKKIPKSVETHNESSSNFEKSLKSANELVFFLSNYRLCQKRHGEFLMNLQNNGIS